MDHTHGRRLTIASSLLIALMAPALVPAAEQDTRPNIVYIVLDEWGYYEWSGMGHPVFHTPNIDRMAREGMRFTQILAGGNVCAPTRSVLMTGLHTGHTTVRTNGGGTPLRDDDVTVAEMLKTAGYAAGGFGKWGLGDRGTTGVPEKQGFDVFFGYYHQVHAHSYYPVYLLRSSEKVYLPGNTGDFHVGETFSHELIYRQSVNFIRQNKDRPFFAYLCWTPPHGRWGMPEDDPAWQKYRDKQWGPTNQRGTHDAQMYAAMIEMVDRQIGEIFGLLKELGIEQKTVVFLSGDNGGAPYFRDERHPHGFFAPNLDPRTKKRFRGGKGNFYEGGLRVPFIARWPGKIKPGTVSDHLGYFPDVMPTLAELAGIEPPKCDGISIVPTLLDRQAAGRGQEQHEYLYWEDPRSAAVRLGDWKAVRPLRKGKAGPWELYDLSRDVEELNDVANDRPEIIAKIENCAKEAHEPVRPGRVLDASLRFQGHRAR